ncbi:MAG TPA: PAS domain S-box protein [Roseiflexaceae bacterium]|nr:PAS domain S-box protein [Roseiflexaceae bacterium]
MIERITTIASGPVVVMLTLLGMVGVLLLDTLTPLGFAHGTLYIFLILLAALSRSPRFVIVAAAMAVGFTIVGFFISPQSEPNLSAGYVVTNRIFSIFTILCVAWLSVAVIRDLQQRKLAQQELARSNHMLRQQAELLQIAGEAGRLGGWSLDVATLRATWSDEVARIHEVAPGYAPTLEEGLAFYSAEYRETVSTLVSACIHEGTPFDAELQIVTARGRPIWVRVIGHAVRDERGQVIMIQGAFQDISERKLVEASLEASRQRFRQMADALPLIVWTATPQGSIDYCSRVLDDFTGTNAGQKSLNEHWVELMHPDDRQPSIESGRRTIPLGIDYETTFRIRRHDGAYCWHLARAVPIRDAAGAITAWYGYAINIDDQQRLTEESQRLATRQTTILESITDAFFTLDRDWRFTYLNSQAERLLQHSRDALIGTNVWEAFADAVPTQFYTSYYAAVQEQHAVHFEEYYEPLQMWFDVSAYPSEEGLAVYFRDITQRRATETQLRLLETAIARLNDIVMITEAEPLDEPGPRIVFVNNAFERQTGYAPADVIGKSPRFLQGPNTNRAELDRIKAALSTWQPVRAELLNYTKDGREIWLEVDIVPIADATGWFTHWVAVERDITERMVLEEQLRQSQRLEAICQLTGGMAHDFNNMLTIILGNAELLTEELDVQPDLKNMSEMIGSAAQRGAELTRRLLAFARRQALDPRPTDVHVLLTDIDSLLRRTLGEHIEIELVHGVDLWPALVDAVQLESALLNLCLNARDAMPNGGKLTIETANMQLDQAYADHHVEVQPGQYVLLAVSDTGSGIAPEHLSRVFEPFFTTKEPGKGTGLGLSMVYGFIKQSHGHISIYSEVDEGTSIKLYLPRAGGQIVAPAEHSELPVQNDGDHLILLVEDDELVRQYACQQLKSLGYRVLEAADGPEALAIIQERVDIELLFTDMVMPGGMSGRDLAEAAHIVRPDLKVLYTSGYTDHAIAHHGQLDPGIELLAKPYHRDDLARKIGAILFTR